MKNIAPPARTAADIARAVRPPPGLTAATREIAAAAAAKAALTAEMHILDPWSIFPTQAEIDAVILATPMPIPLTRQRQPPVTAARQREIAEELAAVATHHSAARATARTARRAHSETVRMALQPFAAEAATRAGAALVALSDALGELAACEAELIRAGADALARPDPFQLPVAQIQRACRVWAA